MQYTATANPLDRKTTGLHELRYRADLSQPSADAVAAVVEGQHCHVSLEARRERLHVVRDKTEWSLEHRHLLREMDVSKFVLAPDVQRFIHSLQNALVDKQYNCWGKTEGSWEGYTLMFRNGFQSKDERKPVAERFHDYCEAVYCPIFWTLLFGKAGWEEVRKHWAQFKACTIKVCESGMLYGENIFHMHIDGKIGVLEPRNFQQRHMSRLLFSIVNDLATDQVSFQAAAADPYCYGATNYPIWQPRQGFRSNHEFHRYMQDYYVERGLENVGLPRPHYEIPEDLLYRAVSGEVLINRSHSDPDYGCQPIHSEPNPCPDRHLFVFDWNNIVSGAKGAPSVEVPEDAIIAHMRALENTDSQAFLGRLAEVSEVCREVLAKGLGEETFPEEAISAVETVLKAVERGAVCF